MWRFERADYRGDLPIVITTTLPSLDGFLPQYVAGGGSGFPGGMFTKEGTSDLTLRLEPGKATVFRGKVVEVTFRTAPTRDTVTIFKVPNNEDEAVRPWLSSWQFKDKRLMLSISVDSTKEATLLNGTWRSKE